FARQCRPCGEICPSRPRNAPAGAAHGILAESQDLGRALTTHSFVRQHAWFRSRAFASTMIQGLYRSLPVDEIIKLVLQALGIAAALALRNHNYPPRPWLGLMLWRSFFLRVRRGGKGCASWYLAHRALPASLNRFRCSSVTGLRLIGSLIRRFLAL